jgi:hypothetical protein
VFLDTFGRPNPNQDPPCERTSDTTVTQTLHLMNAPQLHQRVTSDSGQAAKLAASGLSPDGSSKRFTCWSIRASRQSRSSKLAANCSPKAEHPHGEQPKI